MPAPNWNAFAFVTLVVLAVLIALARASQAMLSGKPGKGERGASAENSAERARSEVPASESTRIEPSERGATRQAATSEPATEPTEPGSSAPEKPKPELTSRTLLLNVALSQGLFGAVLVGAALVAAIPPRALGVGAVTLAELGWGVGLGVALFAANELGQYAADALDVDYEDGLRELLTPRTGRGWVVLLVVVLPVIAGFEELLFRAALVGALEAGYGISPWFLAVGSTVAFAVGHGAQGPGGILVTGALGGVLAAAFVLSGSLVVVVVAHYLVNALEFVVHAGRET
ncbi:CPBP family intramembrane glutamic endopeptidase [Haladaptatus sp. NG-WS-4]